MRDKLKQYVSQLFAGSEGKEDMEQEILQNTLDRFDDLIAQGKSEEDAYRQAVAGIGDIEELLGKPGPAEPQDGKEPLYPSMGRKICNAVAVALYILSPIPLFLFQNELGLCCLLGMVACGVAIQVLARHLMDSLEEQDPLSPSSRTAMHATAIALYILSPIPLFLFQDEIGLICLLGMVAIGVAMQIIAGKGTADAARAPSDPVQKNAKSLVGLLVLAVYLLVSFRTHAWWITWIIFPIADALTKLVLAIVGKRPFSKVLPSVIITFAICCLAFSLFGSTWSSVKKYVISSPSGGTGSSSQIFEASEVRSLNIDWVDGSILIQPDSGSTVRYTVTGSNADAAVYALENGTLSISCAKGNLFSLGDQHGKNLTIAVPKDWTAEKISIEAVSAPIRGDDLHTQILQAGTVSGVMELSDIQVETLSLSSISAKITCSGTASTVSLNTTSGNCFLALTKGPEKIQLDSVSGDLELLLPKKAGFSLDLDTVSGKFRTDFDYRCPQGSRYVSGDGSCVIRADTVSGDVNIRQG